MTATLEKMTSYEAALADVLRAGTPIEPAWLTALRRRAFEHFRTVGFPTTREEEWRFTSLAPIVDTTFNHTPPRSDVRAADLARFRQNGELAALLVFVNGVFAPDLSEFKALPKGATVAPIADSIAKHGKRIEAHLGHHAKFDRHGLMALNTALFRNGFYVHLDAGTVVEKPIKLLHISTGATQPVAAHARHLMIFEPGSQATLIETHAALDGATYFNTNVTEVVVGANAHIDHYRVQEESLAAFHYSALHLVQDRASTFRSHAFDFGGALVRNDLFGTLDGEGCEAILNGLYMLKGRQHVDNFMWVEHVKPNIPSHELYKGILDDNASAVFTGRIYVHSEAQKTDAKQTNQNLLLSDNARVNTKPQLEIYADDVKCTHGATIGQMDQTALFYLMSRGVARDEARNLLVLAFASDITERIRLEPLRERVAGLLRERLLS